MNILRMAGLSLMVTATTLTATTLTATAQNLPIASPKSVGMSEERLARITDKMNAHVEAGHISGGTGLIVRHGKVAYSETWGYQDIESQKAMPDDAIFRIYSMSKAITGVAVMMLHEEGHFFLTDPVSKYLPEYKDMTVVDDNGTTKDAENEITIRDLMMHTAGINYGSGNSGAFYRDAGVRTPGGNLEDFSNALGTVPLEFEPGTEWEYGFSIDVLGRLVEVISGKTFDVFLDERIFTPLGMKDTAFYVPEEYHERLVTLYSPTDNGGIRVATSSAQDSYKKKPSFFSGGGGLVSSTMDYARFCQMLINNGNLDGVQLLGKKSVELMSTDHLGDTQKNGYLIASEGVGFGLTFAVINDIGGTGALGSNGSYNWGGAAGTRFWLDPQEDLFGVFMVNILPHTGLEYGNEFKLLTYQAIVE